jgi:hypothetical protein
MGDGREGSAVNAFRYLHDRTPCRRRRLYGQSPLPLQVPLGQVTTQLDPPAGDM